jgi:hypothetical protein
MSHTGRANPSERLNQRALPDGTFSIDPLLPPPAPPQLARPHCCRKSRDTRRRPRPCARPPRTNAAAAVPGAGTRADAATRAVSGQESKMLAGHASRCSQDDFLFVLGAGAHTPAPQSSIIWSWSVAGRRGPARRRPRGMHCMLTVPECMQLESQGGQNRIRWSAVVHGCPRCVCAYVFPAGSSEFRQI